MPGRRGSELSPGEWAVLGAVAEGPTHGFALARLLGPDGVLGRVWTLPRPVVYQALRKLEGRDLVVATVTERSDRGPDRTIVGVTPSGQRAVRDWLAAPVAHVRDVRSELLLKLALLERAGADAGPLVAAQRALIAGRRQRLQSAADQAAGFDRVVAMWRLASVGAVVDFLDSLDATAPAP